MCNLVVQKGESSGSSGVNIAKLRANSKSMSLKCFVITEICQILESAAGFVDVL